MGAELIISCLTMEADLPADRFPWYGIRIRSNHEKVAAIVLKGKGYDTYLPVYRVRRSQSEVQCDSGEYPLFPGYLFCRFDVKKRLPMPDDQSRNLGVGFGREPAAIPDEVI